MNLSRTIEIIPSTVDRRGGVSTSYYCPTYTGDCEGVMFVMVGSSYRIFKTLDFQLHLQGSSWSSANWTNIGSTVALSTATPTGFKKSVHVIDCYKPIRKYVRLAAHHSSGDQQVIAIKYGLRRAGSTEALGGSSGLGAFKLLISST
ncbi:MAG: hypothetical protein H7831_06790 [Magnetococcus sp. WYHC-3]